MEEQYELVSTIMAVFAVFYLLFEIVLNLNDIDNDTSNIILLEWSREQFFFIPFALGAIVGHLFLGTKNDDFEMANGIYPVVILFVSIIIAVVIGYKVPFKKSKLFLTSLLLFGVLYAHFFWSMNYVQ